MSGLSDCPDFPPSWSIIAIQNTSTGSLLYCRRLPEAVYTVLRVSVAYFQIFKSQHNLEKNTNLVVVLWFKNTKPSESLFRYL